MFPVISLLRRASAKVVYVEGTEPFVLRSEGAYRLRLDKKAEVWDAKAWAWKVQSTVPMFSICTTGADSKILLAKSASSAEDLHAVGMKALEVNYTLFLNEEKETETLEGYVRELRFGVAKGIFRIFNEIVRPD